MKLKSAQEEKLWLQDLQNKLIEDRKAERCQASPLFYTIRDYRQQITEEGYEDDIVYFDTESQTSMNFDELIEHLQEQGCLQDLLFDETLRQYNDGKYEILDTETLHERLSDIDIMPLYMCDIPIIVPDTLFLTRAAAKQHLDSNYYHYTKDAHTYAMTAWRSPEYEHLLELLHNIDFEKSNIVLKDHSKA